MTRSPATFAPIASCLARSLTALAPAALWLTAGCLERPVAPAKPTTTNVYVGTITTDTVDKVDLLFMIDNSMSMADKQQILAKAVPVLVRRLVTPTCFDESGHQTGVSDSLGRCRTGRPEFDSVKDIHVGVITSSLGDHGGSECKPELDDAATARTPNDRAELLPTANPAVRGPLPSWNDSGFLAWDPSGTKNTPPGEADLDRLTTGFREQVQKAGENGCGYEGSLEAWYRFLVDPEPPISVTSGPASPDDPSLVQTLGPVNQTLLAQRKAFLRPDSLLAIVMLTDENDCSIVDGNGGLGWLASSGDVAMPRASAACAEHPDDHCCHTCAVEAPSGCTPNASDAECSKAGASDYATLASPEDSPNLRCFQQKRRFGLDLLYPTQRYVDGLTRAKVPNRGGNLVQNPIFAAPPGKGARSPNLVLLTGILGVPWQDIASPDSLKGPGLRYLTAHELKEQGRWSMILGDENGPSDPLMRESVAPRTGTHPLLGWPMAPPSATGESTNPINGHEQNVVKNDDLQYACTFELPVPRQCSEANGESCDCMAADRDYNRPLCNYAGGPGTDGVQVAAKAYPGLRELAVLRGMGENGVVASICPKHTEPALGLTPEEDDSYGYNPAINAIATIIKSRLAAECLPRPLPVETDPKATDFGKVPCAVVEAVRSKADACGCDETHARAPLSGSDEALPSAVREQLRQEGHCGDASGVPCTDYCLCKLDSLTGPALDACQHGRDDGQSFGYCYVDPGQGIGDPALVADCPATKRRSLRFMGEGLPAEGSVTFMACQGAALGTSDDATQ